MIEVNMETTKERVKKVWDSQKYKTKDMENIRTLYVRLKKAISDNNTEKIEDLYIKLGMDLRSFETQKEVKNFIKD